MARRGHNEGSIYKREDGRWAATVSVGYDGGKRSRQTYYGKTRKAVQQKLIAVLSDAQKGVPVPRGRQTVEQFVSHWMETVVRVTVKTSTCESYERLLRVQVIPRIGRLLLQKLEPEHLSAMYADMVKKGSAPRTAQYAHAVLHRALSQAVRWNLLGRNPGDHVDPPRVNRVAISPLDSGQVSAFLRVARTDRLYALYVLALTTGMREGELLGLRWSDVDFASGMIRVRQQVGRTKRDGVAFSEPKTAKGRRSITVPLMAVAALHEHRSGQLKERLFAGSKWLENDLAFPNGIGNPIEPQNLTRRSFRPLLALAGLPAIRFHDLRHSAATLLLSQGIHPKVVQERLGHASIAITMDVYSHVMPSLQREAAEKLDAFFAAV